MFTGTPLVPKAEMYYLCSQTDYVSFKNYFCLLPVFTDRLPLVPKPDFITCVHRHTLVVPKTEMYYLYSQTTLNFNNCLCILPVFTDRLPLVPKPELHHVCSQTHAYLDSFIPKIELYHLCSQTDSISSKKCDVLPVFTDRLH